MCENISEICTPTSTGVNSKKFVMKAAKTVATTTTAAMSTLISDSELKVAEMSLAEHCRKENDLAEVEMPGVMACREEMGG